MYETIHAMTLPDSKFHNCEHRLLAVRDTGKNPIPKSVRHAVMFPVNTLELWEHYNDMTE